MQQRRFVLRSISGLAVLAVTGVARAAPAVALKKIDPTDPQAVALGYVDDTKQADQKKYPQHTLQQFCRQCQFYQLPQQAGNLAPCSVLSNKAVAAQGWCSAYVKRPA